MNRLEHISSELQNVLRENNVTMPERIAVFSTALAAFLFNITDQFKNIPEDQKEDFKRGMDFLEIVGMAAISADEEMSKMANGIEKKNEVKN